VRVPLAPVQALRESPALVSQSKINQEYFIQLLSIKMKRYVDVDMLIKQLFDFHVLFYWFVGCILSNLNAANIINFFYVN